MSFFKSQNPDIMNPILGSALLILLASCNAQSPSTDGASHTKSISIKPSVLLTSTLPSPYNTYPAPVPGGACAVDRGPDQSENEAGVSGWGIIDAKNGDVPDMIILKVDSKAGIQYSVPKQDVRPDVSKYFNNPRLANSGFVGVLPIPKSNRPAIVSALLAFKGRLFECPKKLEIPS